MWVSRMEGRPRMCHPGSRMVSREGIYVIFRFPSDLFASWHWNMSWGEISTYSYSCPFSPDCVHPTLIWPPTPAPSNWTARVKREKKGKRKIREVLKKYLPPPKFLGKETQARKLNSYCSLENEVNSWNRDPYLSLLGMACVFPGTHLLRRGKSGWPVSFSGRS